MHDGNEALRSSMVARKAQLKKKGRSYIRVENQGGIAERRKRLKSLTKTHDTRYVVYSKRKLVYQLASSKES